MSEATINQASNIRDFINSADELRNVIKHGVYPNLVKFQQNLSEFNSNAAAGGKFEALVNDPSAAVVADLTSLIAQVATGSVLSELDEALQALIAIETAPETAGIFGLDLPAEEVTA